jgi:hypothetical protein
MAFNPGFPDPFVSFRSLPASDETRRLTSASLPE